MLNKDLLKKIADERDIQIDLTKETSERVITLFGTKGAALAKEKAAKGASWGYLSDEDAYDLIADIMKTLDDDVIQSKGNPAPRPDSLPKALVPVEVEVEPIVLEEVCLEDLF